MTFEEMAKARYSVKQFKDTPVEKEKLDKIAADKLYEQIKKALKI